MYAEPDFNLENSRSHLGSYNKKLSVLLSWKGERWILICWCKKLFMLQFNYSTIFILCDIIGAILVVVAVLLIKMLREGTKSHLLNIVGYSWWFEVRTKSQAAKTL